MENLAFTGFRSPQQVAIPTRLFLQPVIVMIMMIMMMMMMMMIIIIIIIIISQTIS